MPEITELLWDDQHIAHIVGHLDTPTAGGATYVLTARPMTTKERHTYDQLKGVEG